MNNIVVDASVVAPWLLPDEPNQISLKIKQDFTTKSIFISAPFIIFYEVNNLLNSATRRLRVSKEEAETAYKSFLNLDFTAYSSKSLMELTLIKALDFNISSYDASYIALAEYLQVPLYTADERLLRKTKNSLVKPLSEYSLGEF